MAPRISSSSRGCAAGCRWPDRVGEGLAGQSYGDSVAPNMAESPPGEGGVVRPSRSQAGWPCRIGAAAARSSRPKEDGMAPKGVMLGATRGTDCVGGGCSSYDYSRRDVAPLVRNVTRCLLYFGTGWLCARPSTPAVCRSPRSPNTAILHSSCPIFPWKKQVAMCAMTGASSRVVARSDRQCLPPCPGEGRKNWAPT